MFPQLLTNELMQSNVECYFDEQTMDFPDSWVVLYNQGEDTISLGEYRIGLTNDYSVSYQLPEGNVAPYERIAVFCDKVGKDLHTDFHSVTVPALLLRSNQQSV